MSKHRHPKQLQTFKARLASFAKEMREKAAQLSPGLVRDDLLKKARQAETAVNIEEWANSPGLKPPE